MRPFLSLKIGLACTLSFLVLMLGLYTTTGAASAHTTRRPFLIVASNIRSFGNCASFQLAGGGFGPFRPIVLSAHAFGSASITPNRVRANGNGNFSVGVITCNNTLFSNCGGFIQNPGSFCGFNLPSQDFCGFNFEPNQFCSPQQTSGQFPGCSQFQCGFQPISVSDFCRFHFHQNFPFCFRFFPQDFTVSFLVTATDVFTGNRANLAINVG
jgi:hypothetical protein